MQQNADTVPASVACSSAEFFGTSRGIVKSVYSLYCKSKIKVLMSHTFIVNCKTCTTIGEFNLFVHINYVCAKNM